MTTAIYLRVSTDEQARDGVSLAMQRERCLMYAKLHDLPGDPVIYEDAGKSASSMDRPALDRLRSHWTSGHIEHVVILKLDRLTRNMGNLCTLLDEIDKYGFALHAVDERLDTASPAGRLVIHVLGSTAEFERGVISQRTKAGMAHIQSQGYHLGGAPFGWELVKHDGPGSLLMPSEEYPLISDARKAHEAGMSLAGIGNIIRGKRHPQVGKRIVTAPLVEDLVPVKAECGSLLGYRHPA